MARLIRLANMTPEQTKGSITGQVRACIAIAELRGEIIHRHQPMLLSDSGTKA